MVFYLAYGQEENLYGSYMLPEILVLKKVSLKYGEGGAHI